MLIFTFINDQCSVPVTSRDLLYPSVTQDLFIDFYNSHHGVFPIQTYNYTTGTQYNCNILVSDCLVFVKFAFSNFPKIMNADTGNYTRWGHPSSNFVCTATSSEQICVWTNTNIQNDQVVRFPFV